jgi:phosphohistidine swiveling domain-containing protein
VAKWLLSGHNPRETIGLSYPITADYFAEFMTRRQFEYLLQTLAGGLDEFDTSMPILLMVQGYVYVNVNFLMRNMALVLPITPESVGAPEGLLTSDRKPRLTTQMLLPFRGWRIYRETAHISREVMPHYRKTLDEIYWGLRACDPDHPTEQDLALADRLFEPSVLENAAALLNAIFIAGLPNIAILEIAKRKAPDLFNLLVGYGTSTAQLATRMWELRQTAAQCGSEVCDLLRRGKTDLDSYRDIPEAAPLLEAIERFMRMYGHRAFHYSSQFEATRLADQPDLVLLTMGGLLEKDEPPSVRAEAARQVGLRALQKMNPIKRLFWKRLLKLASALIELREESRDIMELQNATYGLAAKLLTRHYFPDQSPDYLYLYTFDELLAFGQSHGQQRVAPEQIEQRRAELGWHRKQEAPPELIWYDPKTQRWWPVQEQEGAEEPTLTSEGWLQGIGASAGSGPVEGLAVVTNSVEDAVERILGLTGPVVLVTHATDPAWSSLFGRLTAVVTEMGGAVSHAAVVARESGIPAVVGAHEATRRIRDGQRVRVDGAAGTIEAIE